MTSIARFAPVTGAFDPEATRILGRAFDMACALVGHTPQPTAAREAIARAIVKAAKQGERDPHRLRDAGLAAMEPANRPSRVAR
jgi:ribosomal protein S9